MHSLADNEWEARVRAASLDLAVEPQLWHRHAGRLRQDEAPRDRGGRDELAGGEDGLLAQIGVAIHGFAASFWFIAPLLLWPRGDGYDASVVRRFSEAAIWIVPMVFAAGGYLAWRLAGGLTELFTPAYGQLLSAKLAVALVVLALGAVNKQIVSRWLATDPPQGRRLLRLTLGADAAVFLTALALVSWASTVSGPS